MNKFKKEALRKYNEAREGLNEEQLKELEIRELKTSNIKELADEIHLEKFPEEYDFYYDSGVDVKERNKGINPMSQEYIEKVRIKREMLGVSQLSESGMGVSDDSYKLCEKEARELIAAKRASK